LAYRQQASSERKWVRVKGERGKARAESRIDWCETSRREVQTSNTRTRKAQASEEEQVGGRIIPTRLSKGQRRARRDPGRGRGGSCAGPQTAAKGGSKLVLSASDSNQSSASREWGAPSLGENLFRERDARMSRWLLTARLNRGAGFNDTKPREALAGKGRMGRG
jgi:hypothetical protein